MPDSQRIIQEIGMASQLAGCVLLAVFFGLLRRYARRRPYFLAWAYAWVALGVALAAVVARMLLIPEVLGGRLDDDDPAVRPMYFLYQYGKLLFAACLVLGTIRYVRGPSRGSVLRYLAVLTGVYALLSLALSTGGIADIIVWQAPIASIAFAYCGLRFLTLPSSRRTLGTAVTGVAFTAMTLVWVLYIVGFPLREEGVRTGVFAVMAIYNAYIDLFLNVVLGYGMVVLLMEDAKREVDNANAELAAAHDQLRRASLYDALTGALNRTAFNEGVGLELARATYGAAVVLDLDNLKVVNDTHGHPAGDELLRYLVRTLRAALRPTDKLYRWGGDEFLLVLPGAKAALVQRRIEEIIAAAEPLAVVPWAKPVTLLASLGAADYPSGERLQYAIERADDRMYEQKNARKMRRAATPSSVPVGERAD